MRTFFFKSVFFSCLLAIFSFTGCSTRHEVPDRYEKEVHYNPGHESKSTTVYILIDGLSLQTLKPSLTTGKLPNIQHFFLGAGRGVREAHTVFPSLTYPSISSLLHEAPVNETNALGNFLVVNGQLIPFESMLERSKFSEKMRGHNIFTRLRAKDERSVSLDYGLGVDADASSDPIDIKAGIAVELDDYIYLDEKRISSLKILLSETPAAQWPDFVFLHLVGLDFVSHQKGSQSPEAYQYLQDLDRKLEKAFASLEQGEKDGHHVVSILSADHGFRPATTQFIPLEEIVHKIEPNLGVINEGRMASLFYKEKPGPYKMPLWSAKLLAQKGIEIVAYRKDDTVHVMSKRREVIWTYQKNPDCPDGGYAISIKRGKPLCPSNLPGKWKDAFYPFMIENLSHYFQAESYPDMVLIPTPETSFQDNMVGFHGGPTPEETLIPVLMRNANLGDPKKTPAIWELLRFL